MRLWWACCGNACRGLRVHATPVPHPLPWHATVHTVARMLRILSQQSGSTPIATSRQRLRAPAAVASSALRRAANAPGMLTETPDSESVRLRRRRNDAMISRVPMQTVPHAYGDDLAGYSIWPFQYTDPRSIGRKSSQAKQAAASRPRETGPLKDRVLEKAV